MCFQRYLYQQMPLFIFICSSAASSAHGKTSLNYGRHQVIEKKGDHGIFHPSPHAPLTQKNHHFMAKNTQKFTFRRLFVVVSRLNSRESSYLLTFSNCFIASHNPEVAGSNPVPATKLKGSES